MSIRAAQMVHYQGTTRVLRAQNIGISNFNIPTEKVGEVGRDETLETTFETPDLTYDVESWDMTTRFEEKLVRSAALTSGQHVVFDDACPQDWVSPWTLRRGSRAVEGGYAAPYTILERAQYRFTNTAASSQTFTFKGDGAFFVPEGTPRSQEFTKAGTGPYSFDDTAKKTVLIGQDVYALNVTAMNDDGTYRRLRRGDDYTDTSTGFTLTASANTELADTVNKLAVVYGTAVKDTIVDATDDPGITVVPSQVKGKHVDLYVGTAAATPTLVRWPGVQSYEAGWSVSYEEDRELGNLYAVARDYDEAQVSGSITVRAMDVDAIMALYTQITGATAGDILNSETAPPLALHARIRNPQNSSQVLKTIVVEDARINISATQGRTRQKTDVSFPFNGDSGVMKVYNGQAPF